MTVKQDKIAASHEAKKALAEKYPDDFHRFMAAAYRKRNLPTYVPPPTEQDKARKTVEELLAKYPELKGQVFAAFAVDVPPGGTRAPTVDEHLGAEPAVADDSELPEGHGLGYPV